MLWISSAPANASIHHPSGVALSRSRRHSHNPNGPVASTAPTNPVSSSNCNSRLWA